LAVRGEPPDIATARIVDRRRPRVVTSAISPVAIFADHDGGTNHVTGALLSF